MFALVPFVAHQAVHPLVAIFTLMIGASVGGLAGAYLSLPIAAVIRVVWTKLGHFSVQPINCESGVILSDVKESGLDLYMKL